MEAVARLTFTFLREVNRLLDDSVEKLKGVGEKIKQDLADMNIYTIADLINYFPYRFEFTEIKPIVELVHEDKVTIVGTAVSAPSVTFRGRARLVFNVIVDNVTVRAVLFNRMFAKNKIKQGTVVTLTGKWDAHRLQITVSKFQIGKPKQTASIEPIYSVKGNVTNYRLRTFIQEALKKYHESIEEFLPEEYLINYKLPNRKQAIRIVHQPQNKNELKHARRRFIYEEFLLYQLKLQLHKQRRKEINQGIAYPIEVERVHDFMKKLPFALTNAQKRAFDEILTDMKSSHQMYRLLQGDVGSGKTIVAVLALYAAVTAGVQGALMVPTEIVAEQHLQTLKQLLGDQVNVRLLTSSVKAKERKEIIEQLKDHTIQIIVGTHSLIQDDLNFHQLGLVVIDEQHRFGVEQRRLLREKGASPDVLLMTATPIPRTLAITAFGDLDISIIDELPAGRKEVQTYVVQEHMLPRILNFVEKKVRQGEQVYFVSPLIEESEAFDYENAVDLYEKLTTYYPPTIKIGLLHGRLPNEEKEQLMKQFLNREIHILVATTVIEVGVNVPNATIMIIHDAERFGLAQLHQLRGRVGRGDQQSYCILIADPKGEVGKERMKIIAETNDGFQLAEADLKLRGPGDLFGKKQSGIPEFKFADPVHDIRALQVASRDASVIVYEKRLENNAEYALLQKIIIKQTVEQFD